MGCESAWRHGQAEVQIELQDPKNLVQAALYNHLVQLDAIFDPGGRRNLNRHSASPVVDPKITLRIHEEKLKVYLC